MASLMIPYQDLSPEALRGVIEEFVTRDGTDYGETEISLETKIKQVLNQLHAGTVIIVFDQKTKTCNIVPSGDITIDQQNCTQSTAGCSAEFYLYKDLDDPVRHETLFVNKSHIIWASPGEDQK